MLRSSLTPSWYLSRQYEVLTTCASAEQKTMSVTRHGFGKHILVSEGILDHGRMTVFLHQQKGVKQHEQAQGTKSAEGHAQQAAA